MDGLEAVEIAYSNLFIDNEKFRVDAEFFMKRYIDSYEKVKKCAHTQVKDEIDVLTDFHANGSYESIAKVFELLDEPDYAYMVRTTDLETKNYTENVKYVSEKSYHYLSKSKVFGREVLFNKIGSPGRVYIMPTLDRPTSLGMNLFMLRLKENSVLQPVFVWIFFNTELGKNIIYRKVNGTVPLTIDKEAVKSLYIPVFSQEFQTKLSNIYEQFEHSDVKSKTLYLDAETLLLKEIKINYDFNNKRGMNVKSLSNSFTISSRLDAEYYQPKFDHLLQDVNKYNPRKLSGENGLVTIKKSIEPGSDYYGDEGVPFVRISNLSKYEISEPDIKIPFDTVDNIISIYPKKDTILLSKDGSVGIAYKVEADMECVTSGAILHLTVNNTEEILPDYLTLVLNSKVVQMQAERDAGGSIIQHWKPSEIADVIIPVLDMDKQIEISEKIKESFALRRKSEELLELAKTAVEIAIEQGEDVAMKMLDKA